MIVGAVWMSAIGNYRTVTVNAWIRIKTFTRSRKTASRIHGHGNWADQQRKDRDNDWVCGVRYANIGTAPHFACGGREARVKPLAQASIVIAFCYKPIVSISLPTSASLPFCTSHRR
jgi:hypothetical protein